MVLKIKLYYLFLVSSIFIWNTKAQKIIVGGACAEENAHPYHAQLFSGTAFCGSSIISNQHVITARHCVEGIEPSNATVLVGSHTLHEGIRVGISKIEHHPSSDAALLYLDKTLEFKENVQSIELLCKEVPEESIVTIIGFGKTSTTGDISTCLKENTLTSLKRQNCDKLHPEEDDILCIDHPEDNGACFGDSGGGAIHENKLVGIASSVINGCGSTYADAYVRIDFIYDWIVNQIH